MWNLFFTWVGLLSEIAYWNDGVCGSGRSWIPFL